MVEPLNILFSRVYKELTMAGSSYYDYNDTYNQDQNGIDPNTGQPTGSTGTGGGGWTNPDGTPTGPPRPADVPDPDIDPTTGKPYPPGAIRKPTHGGQLSPAPETRQESPSPFGVSGLGGGATGGNSGGVIDISGLPHLQDDPKMTELTDLLMNRAHQSLNIDPLTDPIIRPQVDNYGAAQTRLARQSIDSQAEAGNPYATGSLQTARNHATEQAGFNTANLQSSLMTNELTARRKDITDALQESGQLLTGNQQLKLQQELGLIDASLKQQGLNSGNDQFMAQFGLNSENQKNYWDSLRSGLLG